jgi:hypothetical protein
MSRKMQKTIVGRGHPNGTLCLHCDKPAKHGESVIYRKTPIQGTLLFHKGCLFSLTKQNWPESQYDAIRKEIIANPELVLG